MRFDTNHIILLALSAVLDIIQDTMLFLAATCSAETIFPPTFLIGIACWLGFGGTNLIAVAIWLLSAKYLVHRPITKLNFGLIVPVAESIPFVSVVPAFSVAALYEILKK